MAINFIRSSRRSFVLTVLFVLLYLSFVSIHLIADQQLDYVPRSRFRETDDFRMTISLESGVYWLILDTSGLLGPLGKTIPVNLGLINIKGEIDALTITTLNEFMSFNEILKIRFTVSPTLNIVVSFESTTKISGAIYNNEDISSFENAKIISNVRLIPFIGMIMILGYGVYQFVIRLRDADYNVKDAILGDSVKEIPKKAKTNENSAVTTSNLKEPPVEVGRPDDSKLSRKERKEIEKKEKEEAKLLAIQEAEVQRKQELDAQMRNRIETFRKVVLRSAKLRINQLADMLDMEDKALLKWLYDLPEEFGFVVNQDIIEFDTVKIGDSIDKLLAGFDKVEETKDGKM
ncbi:MAG: hypothetical protein GPJ54_22655 [Candidatus Heimdallarchaeota archaeon]|nr:hypothetical protein [Candidatus Heimdallarchaeota archaeon]